MKQYFYFFFDQDGSLCCVNEYKFQERRLFNEKALNALNIVGNLNIKKIIIKDNSMNLISKNNKIVIDDLDQFYHKKYFKFLPTISATIKNSMRFNIINNQVSDSICVNNMTFYTDHYKKKIAIKSGNLVLFSSISLLSSIILYNNYSANLKSNVVSDIINQSKDLSSNSVMICNKASYIIKKHNEMEMRRLEEEAKQKELERRNYKNFTSYNDETKYAYDNYFDIVYDEATRWGLDPNLVMAILIQESKGKCKNLMQLSSCWYNHSFECYDFIDQEYKKVVLNDLNTPRGNIRAGCIILRHSIEYENNNIMAGAQCYNLGDGNMDAVIYATCKGENKTKDDLLANQDDISFVSYTKYANGGDKHYIANISKYLNETDYISYLDIDENNNIIEYKHNLKEKEKVLKK